MSLFKPFRQAPRPSENEGGGLPVAHWLPEIEGDDPESLVRLAAGESCRLGELVTAFHEDHARSVAQAVEEAQRTGERIGEALVRLSVITEKERDILLEFQRHQKGDMPTEERLRLGNILLAEGHLTREQLGDALARQRASGRKLGEELVASGKVHPRIVERALAIQRVLVTAALAAAVAMANPGFVRPAAAAQVVSQRVNFVIKVPPMVQMQTLRQPAALELSPADVARGFIEIPAAALIEVKSNTPWEVAFHPTQGVIKSARVSGLQGDLEVGPNGASQANLMPARKPASFELSYRFDLAPGVTPGSYPWPLSVSAHAI